MERLGEGFHQPVGERLAHDVAVVVLVFASGGRAGHAHREAADVVLVRWRRHEVRQAEIHVAGGLLLAQMVQVRQRFAPGFIAPRHYVVAIGVRCPEAHRAVGLQGAVGNDGGERVLGILVEIPGSRAHYVVIEDGGEAAGQLPSAEERRPVDERH